MEKVIFTRTDVKLENNCMFETKLIIVMKFMSISVLFANQIKGFMVFITSLSYNIVQSPIIWQESSFVRLPLFAIEELYCIAR